MSVPPEGDRSIFRRNVWICCGASIVRKIDQSPGIPTMTERSLSDVLQRLRRRVLWIGGAAGGFWGITAAVLWLLAGVWLDLVLQLLGELRIAILLSAALAGLIVCF